jgi:hypothetical protein
MSADREEQSTKQARGSCTDRYKPFPLSSYKKFHHKSLDLSTREFRLIRMWFPISTLRPQLEMRHFDFDDEIEYRAVSYTWGDPNKTRHILINGCHFEIRENLWYFLQAIRLPDRIKWYWIDALCIDQSNTRERNHQVSLMSTIYSAASNVVAWIGPAADGSEEVFEFARMFQRTGSRGLLRKDSRLDKAFTAIWERPYWNRLWIVQEIILAPKVLIQCGQSITDWAHFSNVIFSQSIQENEETTIPPLHVYALFSEKKWRSGLGKELSRLIDVFGTFKSEELRIPKELLSITINQCWISTLTLFGVLRRRRWSSLW